MFPPILLASVPLKTMPMFGQNYVDLREWAEQRDLRVFWNKKEQTIDLTNRWTSLSFAVDSRKAVVNGVIAWLSHPIAPHQSSVYITQADLATLLEPILSPVKVKNKKVLTVALAAGHGGKDPGNLAGSHQEKHYTLLLATEVEKALTQAGFKVVQVRDKDEYIPPEEQPIVARKKGADLLLCLHYNSATSDPNSVRGVEIYCLTPRGAASTNGGEVSFRAEDGNRSDAQNVLLAYLLQKSVVNSLDLPDRGLRRARFAMLRYAQMPAILFEAGFMSNSSDLKLIANPSRRREMARAIADGVLTYKRTVERSAPKKK